MILMVLRVFVCCFGFADRMFWYERLLSLFVFVGGNWLLTSDLVMVYIWLGV